MRIALTFSFIVIAGSALAREPNAQHDKAWYLAHPTDRTALLRVCHGDASYDRLADCRNAEAAASGAIGATSDDSLDFLDQPSYWAANPIARAGVIRLCDHPPAYNHPSLRYCAPARAGSR